MEGSQSLQLNGDNSTHPALGMHSLPPLPPRHNGLDAPALHMVPKTRHPNPQPKNVPYHPGTIRYFWLPHEVGVNWLSSVCWGVWTIGVGFARLPPKPDPESPERAIPVLE